MLEKPTIPDEKIVACLQAEFGLRPRSLTFLPLGADLNTAVYRLLDRDGKPYFVKLRRGPFDELSVAVPKFLNEQGIAKMIPPVSTKIGSLWADLAPYKAIVYRYIDGHNAYEVDLSASQWADLGKTFQQIHSVHLSEDLSNRIRRESWSPVNRDSLHDVMDGLESINSFDSLSKQLIVILMEQRLLILDLIDQTNRLAHSLQAGSLDFCLCHGDLHAGNLLIQARGDFYIVDWDDLILAPKEKDLMSIGAGLFGGWHSPAEEQALFYRGYGPVEIDLSALMYYRCERIIADLAVECRQILEAQGSADDRRQALEWLKSNFLPTGTIALARQS